MVLLILSGVTISTLLGDNGIIEQAKRAAELTKRSTVVSSVQLDILMAEMEGEITQEKLEEILNKYGTIEKNDPENPDKVTGLKVEGVTDSIPIEELYPEGITGGGGDTPVTPEEPDTTLPQVTLEDGTKVTLTEDNVHEYLGKKVTNYTGKSSVTISGKSYTVSPTYRLYYVDFANKYGDGEGTIYLKAECTSNNYTLPVTDTSSDTNANIKIRALNPSLYASGVTSPSASNNNMKAVTWLTNTTNWANLADTTMSSNINYIVGSPSLEMMMDSYNTHYQLTGTSPDTSTLSETTDRVKLFYQYPYNSNNYGYGVGPCNYGSTVKEYHTYTSKYSVKTDSAIDTMYYPGSGQYYWLASPSANDSDNVMYVRFNNGGYVGYYGYSDGNAFCPLVSLKSNVQLQIADEPQVTLEDGTKVTLTEDNVHEYLGKKVTNYTGKSSVTISGESYTVSPTYRLYYVDFANKYGDGEGTIYLKAECTSNNYTLPVRDTSPDTDTNIKIKALNPSLYASGVTSPSASNDNMKAVTWLTNTTNWANLADTTMSSNINYIVGSPSLEMMIDSYNTHYQLTGTSPDTSKLSSSTARVKLFYQYPYTGDSNNYGYGVGPSNNSSASNGYYTWTSDYSVKTDSAIDTMYYPGSGQYYWLASPTAYRSNYVMYVNYGSGGRVIVNAYDNTYAFCPLVSLKSNVQLQLQ